MARLANRITFKQILVWTIGIIAVVGFIAYGIFEARRLIEGPRITLNSPVDGTAVGGPIITVAGTIQNAAFFSINGKQVLSDDKGNFAEQISPPPGFEIIEVAARDRFGRTVVKDIKVTVLAECLPS